MNPSLIFSITTKTSFEKTALEIFRIQSERNPVYRQYIRQIGVKAEKIKSLLHIPFLPVTFFKTQKVITESSGIKNQKTELFISSGTAGMERSRHYVSDIQFYEKSFCKCFQLFYGDIKRYVMLALLPSYYENKNSSLLYMVNGLLKRSGKKESGFYAEKEPEKLLQVLQKLLLKKRKVILFGVSFALLHFPGLQTAFPGLVIAETGGMKGRREEITRQELHEMLKEKFKVKKIHSEYGMTELLSQAWSKGNGIFRCPPWMKVFARDVNDPFTLIPPGKTGALNIIDLANIHSCSCIATQDLGRVYRDGSFEVFGRMDNSDLRGCNLLAG